MIRSWKLGVNVPEAHRALRKARRLYAFYTRPEDLPLGRQLQWYCAATLAEVTDGAVHQYPVFLSPGEALRLAAEETFAD